MEIDSIDIYTNIHMFSSKFYIIYYRINKYTTNIILEAKKLDEII